jgi:hypothetical protein
MSKDLTNPDQTNIPDQSVSNQLLLPPSESKPKDDHFPPSGYARKFLSANMFALRAQGHKVLVVRDETLIVFT